MDITYSLEIKVYLLSEIAHGLVLVGEDLGGDVGELRLQLVVHLAPRQLNKFSNLYRKRKDIS